MQSKTPVWSILPRLMRNRINVEQKRFAVRDRQREGLDSFRIVTYNVHRCRGMDRRILPRRIVEVLRELDPDVVALQELLSENTGKREDEQPRYIAEELGFAYTFGENRQLNGSGYGNAILTRLPVTLTENFNLSHRGREERGCLRTDLLLSTQTTLHVYNVHLGTAYHERRHQGRRLVESDVLTREDVTGPRILLGDFNEWLPGLASRLLTEHFGSVDIRSHLGRRRTYPGFLPFLYLDHMYFDDSLRLERATLHRTGKAIVASDHLPLVADFSLKDIS
jgi:endonuclease/exonuclease/phosphatase family metal-dependent hydrolase